MRILGKNQCFLCCCAAHCCLAKDPVIESESNRSLLNAFWAERALVCGLVSISLMHVMSWWWATLTSFAILCSFNETPDAAVFKVVFYNLYLLSHFLFCRTTSTVQSSMTNDLSTLILFHVDAPCALSTVWKLNYNQQTMNPRRNWSGPSMSYYNR